MSNVLIRIGASKAEVDERCAPGTPSGMRKAYRTLIRGRNIKVTLYSSCNSIAIIESGKLNAIA